MKKFLDQVRIFSLQNFFSKFTLRTKHKISWDFSFSKFELGVVRTRMSSNLRKKNPGVVILIPTIILSGLILVVSVGLSQVLITELEFSADLLFSEKAYFAAESGVEKSLLALKGKPLNWVIEDGVVVGTGATYDLNIANSVTKFPFNLEKNKTMKFRLGVDTSESFAGYSPIPVNPMITLDQESIPFGRKLQWKILCSENDANGSKKTVALSGWGNNFNTGDYDNGENIKKNESRSDFLTKATGICFMWLSFPEQLPGSSNNESRTASSTTSQNFAGISGIVSAEDGIAPAKVKITATGKSFSREKIVSFEYLQKNLSSKFDLGLYFVGAEGEE